jgi:hypothetical protein
MPGPSQGLIGYEAMYISGFSKRGLNGAICEDLFGTKEGIL